MNTANDLQQQAQRAILVNLSISQWSGRKFDRKVSDEVDEIHKTKNAGRFNKILIDLEKKRGGVSLKDIQKTIGQIRTYHYRMTLPWSDGGDRVLPVKVYDEYTAEVDRMINEELRPQLDKWLKGYESLVALAEKELNGLFNEKDYPTSGQIRNRFNIHVGFTPVPTVKDFRVDHLAASKVDKLTKEIEQHLIDKHRAATSDLFERAKEAISRVITTLSEAKPHFKNTMVSNIKDMVDVFPDFNYTNDPKLNDLVAEMKSLLVEPENLRKDPEAQSNYLKRAKELNNKFFI